MSKDIKKYPLFHRFVTWSQPREIKLNNWETMHAIGCKDSRTDHSYNHKNILASAHSKCSGFFEVAIMVALVFIQIYLADRSICRIDHNQEPSSSGRRQKVGI